MGTPVDSNQKELVAHGNAAFPIGYYDDDLTNDEVPWHWHEEWEATIVLRGSILIAAGNEKHIIHAGEGFFANSQVLHGCWDWEHSGCRTHSVVFHPRLVGGSLDSVFYQTYVQSLLDNQALESLHLKPEIPWQRAFLEQLQAAWQSCYDQQPGYEFGVRSNLSQLILLLHQHAPDVRKQPSPKQQRSAERIKVMLQFIHDHSADELSTALIARQVSISESECLRCFRSTIGTTPIQYLRQYRIQQAAELLTSTDLPVSTIAERCGFQDLSYFTKTFREMKGCAPTVFRRK